MSWIDQKHNFLSKLHYTCMCLKCVDLQNLNLTANYIVESITGICGDVRQVFWECMWTRSHLPCGQGMLLFHIAGVL